MESIIQTYQLSKRYKKQNTIDELNMTIQKGDIYGFIGENGAGKTTLIRLLTGLSIPTSGGFKLFGVDHHSPDIYTVRKRMSAIVESPSLALNLTGYENLCMHAKLLGLTNFEIIKTTLQYVGLDDMITNKKIAKHYSLGMRQRLGIALSLLGQPDFIILDEPLNGLDPKGIIELRELIIKLNQEHNITFLISSHLLEELTKVATRYGFIKNGTLLKEISKGELLDACKKCTEIHVVAMDGAPYVLENILNITNYKIMHDNIIRIYDTIELSQLFELFTLHNLVIDRINTKNETIEEYYLNIMGGN